MIKIIKNAYVYAPEDKGINDLLIVGGHIARIEKNIPSYPLAEIIDGKGLIVTPGFIDQHVHLTGGGGEGGFTSRVPEIQLSEITHSGITSVVGLLGTDVYTRNIDNLLAKTKALNEEGITAYCLTGGYKYPPITLTESLEKDIIYIDEIIGLKLAISDHRSSFITYDELKRLATQVRLSGMMANKQAYMHFHLGRDPQALDLIFKLLDETTLPISLFKPTHVNKIYKDALKFAKLGGHIDFTASSRDEAFNQVKEAIQILPKGLVTLSSDSNGSLPVWNDQNELIDMKVSSTKILLHVMQELLRTDLKKEDVLSIVTKNVAQSIGKYPQKGSLSINSHADLILFDQDFNIQHVLAKGQFMIKDQKIIRYGSFENKI